MSFLSVKVSHLLILRAEVTFYEKYTASLRLVSFNMANEFAGDGPWSPSVGVETWNTLDSDFSLRRWAFSQLGIGGTNIEATTESCQKRNTIQYVDL